MVLVQGQVMLHQIPVNDAACDFSQLRLFAQYVVESGRRDLVDAVRDGVMQVTDAVREVDGFPVQPVKPVSAWEAFESLWAEASPQDRLDLRKRVADLVGLVEPEINGSKALFPNAAAAKIQVGRKKPTDEEFEAFWLAYPRKTEKGKAKKAFEKAFALLREKYSIADVLTKIMSGVDAYAQNADPDFLCHPATWLNGARWDDDAGSIGKPKKKSHSDFGTYDPTKEDEPW